MNFKAEVPVSHQDIAWAFCGVIEQGYDWFHRFDPVDTPPTPGASHWYADPEFFGRDFKIEVIYDNPEGEEDKAVKKIITPVDVQEGLRLMAEKAPDDLANLISESSADADTYDVFMQYVVLGEVVYG